MFALENLSESERALLLELLDNEHGELPVEIRHTRNLIMREELHDRAKLVQGLIDRIRMPAGV
ncbi:MAG: hypothetical protein ABSA26_13685 [Thermoguttaceae bacterium]|jgi:hypothetical protein